MSTHETNSKMDNIKYLFKFSWKVIIKCVTTWKGILAVCLLTFMTVKILYLDYLPDLIGDGKGTSLLDLSFDMSLAVFAGLVLYFFTVHLKNVRDKDAIQPVIDYVVFENWKSFSSFFHLLQNKDYTKLNFNITDDEIRQLLINEHYNRAPSSGRSEENMVILLRDMYKNIATTIEHSISMGAINNPLISSNLIQIYEIATKELKRLEIMTKAPICGINTSGEFSQVKLIKTKLKELLSHHSDLSQKINEDNTKIEPLKKN